MSGVPQDRMAPETACRWMAARVVHGEYSGGKESPEHYIWRTMLRRKKGKRAQYYQHVSVCERWLVFENFLADMGRRPSPEHQIDRIDPHGNYEPLNCRWTTRSVQQKNKRNTKRWIEDATGTVGTLVEWAEILGISKELAHYRMKHWGAFVRGREWRLLKL